MQMAAVFGMAKKLLVRMIKQTQGIILHMYLLPLLHLLALYY
jgi:hypothetical protein